MLCYAMLCYAMCLVVFLFLFRCLLFPSPPFGSPCRRHERTENSTEHFSAILPRPARVARLVAGTRDGDGIRVGTVTLNRAKPGGVREAERVARKGRQRARSQPCRPASLGHLSQKAPEITSHSHVGFGADHMEKSDRASQGSEGEGRQA